MAGTNVPTIVAAPFLSLCGWKRGSLIETNQYHIEGLKFWTKHQTQNQRLTDFGFDGTKACIIAKAW